MKLKDFVSAYPRWNIDKAEATRGTSHKTLGALHGNDFYKAFDSAFNITPIEFSGAMLWTR